MSEEFERKCEEWLDKYYPYGIDAEAIEWAYLVWEAAANHYSRQYPPEIVGLIEAAREYSQHLPMDDDKIARHSKHLRDSMNLRKAIENIKE